MPTSTAHQLGEISTLCTCKTLSQVARLIFLSVLPDEAVRGYQHDDWKTPALNFAASQASSKCHILGREGIWAQM